ncbi:MAG: hypothetical protein ACI9VR_002156 [Cognaticolwellia sp.]
MHGEGRLSGELINAINDTQNRLTESFTLDRKEQPSQIRKTA